MPDFDYGKFQSQGQKPSGSTPVNTTGFDYSKFQASTQQQGGPPPGLEDTKGLSFATGFANAVDKLRTGILNAVTPAGSTIHTALNNSREFVRHATSLSSAINPKTTTLGEVAGNVAIAAPLVSATGGLGAPAAIAANTAIGAGLGLATNPEDGESRQNNATVGGITGLIGGIIGSGVQGIAKMLPVAKMAKFAEQAPKHEDVIQAGKNLGVEVSPFEASDSVNLRNAIIKKVKMDPAKADDLANHLNAREQQLQQVFQANVAKVGPDNKEESAIYESLKPKQIPEEHLTGIIPKDGEKQTYIQRQYTEAHKESSNINFEEVKPGSFEDLLNTKKYIDTKIQTLNTSLGKSASKGVSSGTKGTAEGDLITAKKQIQKALLSVSSNEDLQMAEQYAKQGGFVSYIKGKIGDIKLGRNQTTPSSEQIHDKLFGTKNSTKEFNQKLDNAVKGHPDKEAILQSLGDWKKVTSGLKDSPVEKLMKQNAFAPSGLSVKNAALATAAGVAVDPTTAAVGLFGNMAAKASSSKSYFNHIWNPIPELKTVPGQTAKQVIQQGGILSGQEANT